MNRKSLHNRTDFSTRSVLPGILLLFVCEITLLGQSQAAVILTPLSNAQETSIPGGQTVAVSTSGIATTTAFSIIEAHSLFANVSLSFAQTLVMGQFITGTNVGLLTNGSTASTLYILNENLEAINVLLILNSYTADAPIPGGCNMEVPIKTAPFLPSSFTQNVLTIEYPLGSWPANVRPATCDRAPLQYDIYLYYLPERDFTERTAFDSLRLMSNITSIERHGHKVHYNGIPPSKMRFANYPGTGRIVSVILRTLTTSSAYVPTLSYGCDPENGNEDENCDVLGSTGAKLLSAWLVFAGLFLLSLGHRYYKCQLFLFGFLVTAVLFYVIFYLFISVGNTAAGTTSTVVGAVGGAAWVTIWAKCGTPIGPVFLASVILGGLFASILAFTPLADVGIMKDDATFWLAYFCLVLVIPMLIISFDKITSILVSALVGAYIFTIPVDHYIGGTLKYIFLNIMRRATDREFSTAIIQPPFQTNDILLTFAWAALAVFGCLFQLWREKDRPPFPPAPPSSRTLSARRRLIEEYNPVPTEASPLLRS